MRYRRIDELYKFLITIYLLLIVFNLFIDSRVIRILSILILALILYRFFSKNVTKRYNENKKYLEIKMKILKPITKYINRIKDRNYVYKKCHHCKTILKLPIPNKIGIKHSKCPTCKKRNTFLVLKKDKIKVIKKK